MEDSERIMRAACAGINDMVNNIGRSHFGKNATAKLTDKKTIIIVCNSGQYVIRMEK
jgi:hypothetical protein